MAFCLDLDHFVDSRDQLVISMLQCLDIYYRALVLLGSSNCSHLERVCVFLQHLVSRIRHKLLCFGRFSRMRNAQCKHHLVLPQRDRVIDRALDLLRHHGVVFLDKPYLRSCLKCYRTGQLKVHELLLKSVAHSGKVLCFLSVLRQSCFLCLLLQFYKFAVPDLIKPLLAGSDIH